MSETDSTRRPRGASAMSKTLSTTPATEESVRALTRFLAVELQRTPTHDEVIRASAMIARLHVGLVVEYIEKERAT